ncbi:MAG TPA: hypothetical protein VF235_05705 [Actinomycetota bacterium]
MTDGSRATMGATAREVVRVDRDPRTPERPLHLVLPGGLVAVVALVLAILVAHRTYWAQELDEDAAVWLFAILGAIYTGGAFLFSYGYRLYDLRRALLLTVFIVLFGVILVALLAAIFIALRDVDLDLSGPHEGGRRGLPDLTGARADDQGEPVADGTCPRCGFAGFPHRDAPCAACGWPGSPPPPR